MKVLLSFDLEEFDMPLEYKGKIDLETQLSISRQGLQKILRILREHHAKATFFSTVIFAQSNYDLIAKLIKEGHELGSHTWFHSQFSIEDLKSSRQELSRLFNTEITGLRMPRLMDVPNREVLQAGYTYNSSLNPTFLPGRYNKLSVSRTIFEEEGLILVPASVSPYRIPLFWLSFHNFPQTIYRHLATRALKSDGYLLLYFHPWEFMNIRQEEFKLPTFATKNTGKIMEKRFTEFLNWLQSKNVAFETIHDFLEQKKNEDEH